MSSDDERSKALNIRQRISPSRADAEYLVLSDLRQFLIRYASNEPLDVLDYGAGYSPYRSLFPRARFRRADYVKFDEVDYVLPYDSTIPESDNVFDLVISTQVAEHLPVPETYFREALRVLKPGGQLICTTHGCWEDHGVPFDFQRWTGDGLRRDLERVGFGVEGIFKITASHRCYVFFLIYWLSHFNCGRALLNRVVSRVVRSVTAAIRPLLHTVMDATCASSRVVSAEDLEKYRFYSVIAAVGRKKFDTATAPSTSA